MPDLLLLFEPKKRDVLEAEIPSWTPYLKDYEGEALVNGNIIKVQYKNNWSVCDGKMVDLIQGDSGAICHLCTTSRNSGNDIAVIEEGFKIE